MTIDRSNPMFDVQMLHPGSIPIVQTYPQGRSIRAYILSTIREISARMREPLQKAIGNLMADRS